MKLQEKIIGETMFANKIVAHQAQSVLADRWLYLIGGIHGDEVEGIYILTQLLEWVKNSLPVEFPIIILPILNVDGYQGNSRCNARNVDLNRNFPVSYKRQDLMKYEAAFGAPLQEAESYYLKKFLDEYPPELLMTFHTTLNGKVITQGETARLAGQFLAKYNRYELVDDHSPVAGSLEAFAHDFYLSDVMTLKVHKSDKHRSFKDIWNQNAEGLKHLLLGQAY